MDLNTLMAECAVCDFKLVLEELKPVFKSTLVQFHTIIFASTDMADVGGFVLGNGRLWKDDYVSD
ncbi:hypothetical protein [Bacteroides caecimuris]|uniref:hypothetical protein n=1 Tax=Bacteroides caecimuris TaxID=1796613 RepID=UPI00242BBEBC|nr:hypothetical protein [Bacteroides caecimuris]